MRLIDADKFAIEEPKLWDWSSVDGISSTAVLKQCIWDVQCAPTVEAIPVELIYKIRNLYLKNDCIISAGVCNEILNMWEAENEAD